MSGDVDLDPLIHPATRLRICSALAPAYRVEFAKVQQLAGLSASALSKQVQNLVENGYVVTNRDKLDSRRLWLRLTPVGRKAYKAHLRALQAIIDAGDVAN